MTGKAAGSLVEAFRRHERAVAAIYLAVAVLFLAAFALPASRVRALTAIQRAVRWWDERWARRLGQGEALLATGRAEEAAQYLSRLDRAFPATNVRHARDKERERLLQLLARANETAGHAGRAIAALERLVAFDSLNYRNHFLYARAAERLLSSWALAPEARDGYAAVLRILPSHLPSLRGYVDYYMDRGEFLPIVAVYRSYLDAHLVQRVDFRIKDSVVTAPLLVDGRMRDIEVPFGYGRIGGAEPTLEIFTDGFSVAIERLVIVPALAVGWAGDGATVELDLRAARLQGLEPAEHGAFRAMDSTAAVLVPLPPMAGGIVAIRVRLALFKPMDQTLWGSVTTSFRNLLDPAGLDSARARTVAVASAEAADRSLARLAWAREGLGLKANELPF